jgi:hypothetical protein
VGCTVGRCLLGNWFDRDIQDREIRIRPAGAQLEGWVRNAGFQFVSASPRLFWRGPFFLANGMQKVFRFAAMDSDGVIKHGWASSGWSFTSWSTGLEDKVVVKWDS